VCVYLKSKYYFKEYVKKKFKNHPILEKKNRKLNFFFLEKFEILTNIISMLKKTKKGKKFSFCQTKFSNFPF